MLELVGDYGLDGHMGPVGHARERILETEAPDQVHSSVQAPPRVTTRAWSR
jgi:hypothetical protein